MSEATSPTPKGKGVTGPASATPKPTPTGGEEHRPVYRHTARDARAGVGKVRAWERRAVVVQTIGGDFITTNMWTPGA